MVVLMGGWCEGGVVVSGVEGEGGRGRGCGLGALAPPPRVGRDSSGRRPGPANLGTGQDSPPDRSPASETAGKRPGHLAAFDATSAATRPTQHKTVQSVSMAPTTGGT